MIQTFVNAWKVPELRKKLLFTLMIILLYRIGANLFVPYVNVAMMETYSEVLTDGIFGMLSLMSGSAFSQATFFALSVSPYITASIVMQLLSIAIPALEKMSKDEEGKKKIAAATRWVTVALAVITAYGYVNLFNMNGWLTVKKGDSHYVFAWFVMIACFCAGASLIMWLAEKINDHGIGNGISIILFANIISGMTGSIQSMIAMLQDNFGSWLTGWNLVWGIVGVVISIALTLAAIVLIVWFTNSERRIKIIYAKKVVGRKMYGGQKTNLPLKMNMAGVMPVIFASSIVSIPATIAAFIPNADGKNGFVNFVNNWLGSNSPIYIIIFIALIVAFSYFYIAISFNPVEVANNIRNNGGAIIGIRPQEMAPFIKKILKRVTMMGAIFLIVIAATPLIVSAIVNAVGGNFTSLAFTGTSLLIAVGVALETVRDLEAQLSMRNYKGFLD
jgi:preprotein translocase subunit SecY